MNIKYYLVCIVIIIFLMVWSETAYPSKINEKLSFKEKMKIKLPFLLYFIDIQKSHRESLRQYKFRKSILDAFIAVLILTLLYFTVFRSYSSF